MRRIRIKLDPIRNWDWVSSIIASKRPAVKERASFPFTEMKTPRKEGTNMVVPSDGKRPAMICLPKAEMSLFYGRCAAAMDLFFERTGRFPPPRSRTIGLLQSRFEIQPQRTAIQVAKNTVVPERTPYTINAATISAILSSS